MEGYLNNKKSPNPVSGALSSMQRMCSAREYCEHDIRLKLKRYELSPAEANAIIIKLKADDFLSEERFALAFVRDKSRLSGWGVRKIAFALKNRRVSEEAISYAFSQLDVDSERNTLLRILETKARSLKPGEEQESRKFKLIRFALSRGFEYDKILQAVNKIIG
ncbi:MAG: regulatory protein RecX [Bacteroidales bacterium]|jgi:regulatory protein